MADVLPSQSGTDEQSSTESASTEGERLSTLDEVHIRGEIRGLDGRPEGVDGVALHAVLSVVDRHGLPRLHDAQKLDAVVAVHRQLNTEDPGATEVYECQIDRRVPPRNFP